MATTENTTGALSEVASVIHHAHQSTVTLMTAKTDGMSGADWTVDEKKRFSGEGHKRRALGYAVENSEDGYGDITIDNRAKKAALREAVETAGGYRAAAEALAEYLRYVRDSEGGPGDPEVIYEEGPEEGRALVRWEDGPSGWAKDFASGQLIGCSALGSRAPGRFDTGRLRSNRSFHLEPKNGYTASFLPR